MDALILFTAVASGAGIGFAVCSIFAVDARAEAELWKQSEATSRMYHDRDADALATLRARVDRALEAETPCAPPAAKRLCRILRGEE